MIPTIAVAQSERPAVQAASPTGSATSSPDQEQPGEIIVTANKREQRLSDVGLAITALSGEALKAQHITTLADIAATIPGLSFTPSQTSTPVYTLRGVGFYETSLAAYPTASVYMDQVPLPFPALTTHTSFDLERVEVLKGPQGTLFGQNSTGGAINFIAAKPTREFEAGGDISYGRFNRFEGNAYVSGPLTDTLRGRIAVTGARADDWQYSYSDHALPGVTGTVTNPGQPAYRAGRDTIGQTEYYAGRILLDWRPSDRLSFNFSTNGWRDRSDPQVPQYQTLLSQIAATTPPALRAFPFAPNKARAAEWSPNPRPHADNRLLQAAARANWEFVDGANLTTISSYLDYKQRAGYETDGTPFYNNDFITDIGRIKSFSQEIRLSNSGQSRFRWILGVNYEKSNVFEQQQNLFGFSAAAVAFGFNPFNPVDDPNTTSGADNNATQRMRNLAGFANAEYDISSQITLKAGIRYTDARRRVNQCVGDIQGNAGTPGSLKGIEDGISAAYQLGFIPVPGLTPVTVPVLDPVCSAIDNVTSDGTPATYRTGAYVAKLNQNNISWRVGIDYKIRPGFLLYLNVANGYKAGSFPVASAATFEQFNPVTQERLTDYEAGFKLNVFDHKLELAGAGFYYSYKNKQLRAKLVDPLFGVLDRLVNVPKSRIIGGELQATWHPTAGLALSASTSILDSNITRFTGLNTQGGPMEYRGSTIPYTPKYQLRLMGDYTWNMGNLVPFVGIVVAMRSHTITNIGGARGIIVTPDFASSRPLDDTFTINGYTTVDLRVGIGALDGDWTATLFGKNVLNKFYLTNIYTDYDTIGRFTGQPATWGVTLALRFR